MADLQNDSPGSEITMFRWRFSASKRAAGDEVIISLLSNMGDIAKELYDARDKPERWSNPVTLPVVYAAFVHPNFFCYMHLKQSQVQPLCPDMITIRP